MSTVRCRFLSAQRTIHTHIAGPGNEIRKIDCRPLGMEGTTRVAVLLLALRPVAAQPREAIAFTSNETTAGDT